MNIQKVLDGTTAGFIGAIANALGRMILGDRMAALIKSPEKLKLLLLPLIDDDWIDLLPALSHLGGKHISNSSKKKLTWVHAEEVVVSQRRTHYYLEHVVDVAAKKNFAFLAENEAERLCRLVSESRFSASESTGRAMCIFPYQDGKVTGMFVTGKEGDICAYSGKRDLSDSFLAEAYFIDHFAVFFFHQAWDDGSNRCSLK